MNSLFSKVNSLLSKVALLGYVGSCWALLVLGEPYKIFERREFTWVISGMIPTLDSNLLLIRSVLLQIHESCTPS